MEIRIGMYGEKKMYGAIFFHYGTLHTMTHLLAMQREKPCWKMELRNINIKAVSKRGEWKRDQSGRFSFRA